ncbi:MAG: hypothetical protein ABI467_29895 [Kofleriaceae bacterium]
MNQLGLSLVLALAIISCSKKDNSGGAGSNAAGSGSAVADGSGSGSAMAGSAMAGSGSAVAVAMAGSGEGSAEPAGSGSGSATWDFDKLTHQQQSEFMKKHVVPTMKPLFQKFDAKRFANFGCKTCHGKDPKKAKFKMPTSDLPKLDFAALKAGKQKPTTAKFMGDVVEPGMAKLLQRPVYNPDKPDKNQFGCLDCHTEKKK